MTKRGVWLSASAGLALASLWVLALPALGQNRPESLLPPGFGEAPEPAAKRADAPSPDARPDTAEDVPALETDPSVDADPADNDTATSDAEADDSDADAEISIDLPPQARRSARYVGLLGPSDGNMGAAAFSGANGRYLARVMHRMRAPIASRWASIVLRRALLSRAATPARISPADWVAERTWLLVRMGEAVSARSLVQAMDVDQYNPALFSYAMQASLASADPAALCPMTDYADPSGRKLDWTLARGICAAFSGEGSIASLYLDRARARRGESSPDVLLAEKVMGAAQNTRRSVTINWNDIDRLDVWRYGMAVSTGMDIPERLMAQVNGRVRAWRAQAPLLSYTQRLPDAERATAMGVFSSAALVDFYAAAAAEDGGSTPPSPLFGLLRDSFSAEETAARIIAMKGFIAQGNPDGLQAYARRVAVARAAAQIIPSQDAGADVSLLISAMLSAGLDRDAARWLPIVKARADDLGWGLLAVGSPRGIGRVSSDQIRQFGTSNGADGPLRTKLLFAGLAGLGRIPAADVQPMADSLGVSLQADPTWVQAMAGAVRMKSPGAVAILSAAGLQSTDWSGIPPAHLYIIVSALRQVGLEGEARMIAAEAVMRA